MLQSRYMQNPDVVLRHVAGESLLIPVKGTLADLQNIFALEGVGEALWEKLDGSLRLNEIASALAEQYGVPSDQVADECEEFLTALMEEGLVSDV